MNKRRQSSRAAHSAGQLALNFDVFAVETPAGVVAVKGENALDAGIRQALVSALDAAFGKGLSRERVADGMADILCRPVTKAHLDLWVAPSQADRRIPVDAFMAVMMVCQDFTPLDWLAAQFARKVLTAEEVLCAEFGAMEVLRHHLTAKSKAIEGQMDEKLFGQIAERIKRG